VIRVADRDKVAGRLQDEGIASAVYYPQPPYLAEPCRDLGLSRGAFPVSDLASDETLAIPLYPEMTDAQIDAVLGAVERAASGGRLQQ
jgi:dTDP-4-amino-4,6-dideoxygalactose transaminase